MTQRELRQSLSTMTIIVDTREQRTVESVSRYEQFGLPYVRRKLDYGDYSAECTLPDGETFSLVNSVAIERKMSIDELCLCLGKDRDRFTREFERASDADAKIYLLVENADWAKIYLHYYRSRMTVPSLVGSLLTFSGRYKLQTVFCSSSFSGKLIADILTFEMRERLINRE